MNFYIKYTIEARDHLVKADISHPNSQKTDLAVPVFHT